VIDSSVNMPKFVAFDMVGTLIRGTKPIGEQYARHAARFGAVPDADKLDSAFRRIMAAAPPMAYPGRSFGESAALEREWWTSVVAQIVASAGLEEMLRGETFSRFFAGLYEHFTTAEAWECYPDVLPALAGLRERGATLGLITNYDTRVFRLLEALGLARFLSVIVVPAHVGVVKPDPAIFAEALSRAGAVPGDALHVGDEIDDDCMGATAAGMQAVLIDRTGRYRGENRFRRIESLVELT
jgi:putative hydrolase of the HAD superfamily